MCSAKNPVAMAWRLAGDEDSRGFDATIRGLMPLAGGDFESIACPENRLVTFDLEGEFSFEDVEELACVNVGVANFAGA
jgi:hypothetical protein